MAHDMHRHGRIVVGVDGSPPSLRALEWALDQAEATGATVEAVHAWEVPVNYGAPVAVLPGRALSEEAEQELDRTINRATGGKPPVAVEQRVVEGHAATALINRAREADLLVVGSRGHGGFVGALIGSVSQHCINHAPCPVVVVREND